MAEIGERKKKALQAFEIEPWVAESGWKKLAVINLAKGGGWRRAGRLVRREGLLVC